MLKLTRRSLIASALASYLLPQNHAAAADVTVWNFWVKQFMDPQGRVIDGGQGSISHSEGQGYGLLLAQAAGDRDQFEALENWSEQHLEIRQDNLMAWRWEPDGRGVVDRHTATDGDLFRAWALLRAARDSGWKQHMHKAEAIAHDLVDLCLAPDPRAPEEFLIKPAAEAHADMERVLLNPSYIMPRALRELGLDFGLTPLVRAADHGETILRELANLIFLPDWIYVTATGFEPSPEHGLQWGHDALRIPLYLVWSGLPRHRAIGSALRVLGAAPAKGHVATGMTKDGAVSSQSNLRGFLAIKAMAECQKIDVRPDMIAAQPYYPAVLHMLACVAEHESSCAAQ